MQKRFTEVDKKCLIDVSKLIILKQDKIAKDHHDKEPFWRRPFAIKTCVVASLAMASGLLQKGFLF